MIARFSALLTLVSLLTLPSASMAHMMGQTLEQEVGEYLVDIGYDAPDIGQGQEVLFNATLIKDAGTTRWQYAPYDEVWLQIGKSGSEPFRAVIPVKTPSPINVRYTFAEAGSYALSVRFLKGGETLADASFTLPVRTAQAGTSQMKGIMLLLFGAFLIIIIGVVAYRRYAEAEPIMLSMPKPTLGAAKRPVVRKTVTKAKAKPIVKPKAKAKGKPKGKKA